MDLLYIPAYIHTRRRCGFYYFHNLPLTVSIISPRLKKSCYIPPNIYTVTTLCCRHYLTPVPYTGLKKLVLRDLLRAIFCNQIRLLNGYSRVFGCLVTTEALREILLDYCNNMSKRLILFLSQNILLISGPCNIQFTGQKSESRGICKSNIAVILIVGRENVLVFFPFFGH